MTRKHVRAIVMVIILAALSRPALADPYQIIGFGDSLMAGYGLQPGQSFPEKLQAVLQAKGHDVAVVNAGVSGDTSSGGAARLDWSVPDGAKLVLLELGANDMLRGIAPDVTRSNLDAMIVRWKARNIAVLLVGMRAAPKLGPEYQARFDAIFPDLAKKHDLPLMPFFLEGIAANPPLQLDDGMHPNAAGVDRMVQEALPVIERLLPVG